ncbi:alpha/beta hydrolase [Halobacteriales archaeon QS_1_69_70]|nr:MAG: alpha/beta hydrolase [Halobacteriales archaeon QS_1_69_70]
MPTVTVDGTDLRYEVEGREGRPAVAFVPDVGVGPWLWGWQAPALANHYRTLVYAQRGTGRSDNTGPYSVGRLAADLEAVLADAGVERVHLVGAGLGGMVALRYAREYGRARSLSLFGAAASGDRVDAEALAVLHPDDPTRLRESLSLAFTDRYLSEAGVLDDVVGWRREEDAVGEALAGHREAALGFEAQALHEVERPALVCHGVDDSVVPAGAGQDLAAALPRGRFEAVEGKRFCFVEHAAAVTDAVDGFLDRHSDAA